MKTITVIGFFCALVLNTAQAKPFVLACEPEWESLAQEIGRDLIKTDSATHGLQNPHFIRVKPSLMSKMRRTDLIICSGADLEVGWLPLLVRNGNKGVQVGQPGYLLISDYVTNIEIPDVLDRSLGDIHPQGNPHVHLDPQIILEAAALIEARLSLIDPDNEAQYKANLKSFNSRWNTALKGWKAAGASLAGKSVIVHHKSFSYLLKFLGINTLISLEQRQGIPPSARHLAEVVSVIKKTPPLAVITTPFDPKGPNEWVSQKTRVRVITLPFTIGGSSEATDLFKLYDQTIELLLN
ncbi:MAG: zinc ABC transporter substrate-binding protein [Proteobacteria bacterium]|nr:zinc ABC transporter substrate-binding protein [Pseudomonadota bacterium]MDA1332370.1 zinc ABC transporter substrate-binding protein [Pseudomonadota bacterium]